MHGGTYTWGLCIGIMSGLLWGINNFLFARGYEQLPISQIASGLDAFSLAIIVPVVCATINDICAAAALLVFNGIRGILSVVRSHLFTKAGFFVCLAALLGGPVGQSAYFLGIAFAGPSAALIITATYPIIGCILSYFFYIKGLLEECGLALLSRLWVLYLLDICQRKAPIPFFCQGSFVLAWQRFAGVVKSFFLIMG